MPAKVQRSMDVENPKELIEKLVEQAVHRIEVRILRRQIVMAAEILNDEDTEHAESYNDIIRNMKAL